MDVMNYKQVCNNWANYINANHVTKEEAIAYVRVCVSTPGVMAHVLFLENGVLSGLSTMASAANPTEPLSGNNTKTVASLEI